MAKRPKTVKRRCFEDVFSAGIWLASAPLHEAGKTTRSWNTLKAGIRREELGFASDNLSSDPNACPLISTFSKPHSEVASTTHLPALKGFRKGAPLFSGLAQDGRSPQQMLRLKNAARRELSRQKRSLPQPAETHNQRGAARCAKSNGGSSSGSPPDLPVEKNFRFAAEAPFSFRFEILHLPAGSFRSDARRKPPL